MWELAVLVSMAIITFTMAFITTNIHIRIPVLQYMFLFLTFIFFIADISLMMTIVGTGNAVYGTFSALYRGMLYLTMFVAFYTFVFLLHDTIKKTLGKNVR